MRELRKLVRHCAGLTAAQVQEIDRQKSGTASPAVAASITAHLHWLDKRIEAIICAVQALMVAGPALSRNYELLLSIPGTGATTAPVLLAELPNIAEVTPEGCRRSPDCRPMSTAPAARSAGPAASAERGPNACGGALQVRPEQQAEQPGARRVRGPPGGGWQATKGHSAGGSGSC